MNANEERRLGIGEGRDMRNFRSKLYCLIARIQRACFEEALDWRQEWHTDHLFYSTAFLKCLLEVWASCSGQQSLPSNLQQYRTAYIAAAKIPAETAPWRFLLKLWLQCVFSPVKQQTQLQDRKRQWLGYLFWSLAYSVLRHQTIFCYTFWNLQLARENLQLVFSSSSFLKYTKSYWRSSNWAYSSEEAWVTGLSTEVSARI